MQYGKSRHGASPRFTRWSLRAWKAHECLSRDEHAQKIVVAALLRIFDLDLAKVEVSGLIYSGSRPLRLFLFEGADVYRAAIVDCACWGHVHVKPLDGARMADLIGRDLEGCFHQTVMPGMGLDPETPASFEVTYGRGGQVDCRFAPCL